VILVSFLGYLCLGYPDLQDTSSACEDVLSAVHVLSKYLWWVIDCMQLKFPTGRPSKPLFFYVVSILQLQRILTSLEDSAAG